MKRKRKNLLSFLMYADQKLPARAVPYYSNGLRIPFYSRTKPEWSVLSGKAKLEVSNSGKKAFIITPGEPGESLISVITTVDLKNKKKNIRGYIRVRYKEPEVRVQK